MGSIIGKTMDENMVKQQAFMVDNQKIIMERQIQMQNYMREQQMAMMMARSREMFNWFGAFYVLSLLGGIAGAAKGKRGALLPAVPLSFIFGYQYDLCYGNKINRIRDEADKILQKEGNLVALPQALPTIPLLDKRRKN